MTAVWYRFRVELRSRWRTWLGLGLLVGLAAGAVMALAAGARRTDSAYARFLEAHDAFDVMVIDYEERGFPGVGGFDEIAALPLVEDSAEGDLDLIPLGSSSVPGIAGGDGRIGSEINRFKILEGRRADPDRPEEVVVSFTTAEDYDLDVGSTIQLLSPDEVEGITDPNEIAAARRFLDQAPDGRLRVVGIEAAPGEFPPQHHADMPMVHLTPAFHDLHLIDDPQTSAEVLLVRLRDGVDGVNAFNAALDRLSDGPAYDSLAQADQATAVERSIHLQAVALWLLAGLVTVSATLIVAQLLSRLTLLEGQDHPTLGALGMSGRDRALLGVIRAAGIAAAGALVGALVAIAVSALLPTGLARTAEPDLGVHLDAVVLGLGATATVAVVVALGAWASWRAASANARRPGAAEDDARLRPSGVARVLARGGWPLPAKVGVHMALQTGRGRTAVPVRTTLAGVALGVGALVAALTFGASLTRLLDSPRLYGVTWDLQLAEHDDETFPDRALPRLLDDPRVEAVGVGSSGSALVEVDGRRVDAIALDSVDGDLALPILAGRSPQGPDEVALGSRTARALGVETGDTVDVAVPGGEPVEMRVVGRAVFPSVGAASRLGEGLVATVAGAEAVAPPDLPLLYELFARVGSGVDPDEVVADLNARAGTNATVEPRREPSDILNFGRVESMPYVLGGILATIAAAALAHLLLSAVRRRRRDLAILKTLGFVRAQVAGTVAWQATAVVVVSLVVAVPLGVALGRWGWTLLADDLGVIARPQVPWLTLTAVVGAALLLANAIALVPGQIAARTQPATDLRSE
ncbi:MAG TPA: ABC transporter permease [Acidimicrobiales bacterium]|nr:ABC transporter permease [Acidimicrobiales bacterium]